jgi:uncharacterized protein (DUF2235 family)
LISTPTSRRLPKRLALFLDGTWNTVSDNTNIWRLRALFPAISSDGAEQRAYYSTGLGTKFGEKIRGGMFGRGIDFAITSAYEWLMENYEYGDEIFIFGFSRGSYTARSLSGFVSKCGLLKSGAPLGVNQLYKRYRTADALTIRGLISKKSDKSIQYTPEEQWMIDYTQVVPIKFIGVFDTVGSLGVPFPFFRRLRGSAYPFLNTGLRINNSYAFHALALDEHRKAFEPTLWTTQGAAVTLEARLVEKTEQRWFIGAHANVGGGYFTDPLAQLPLKWLENKASEIGLSVTDKFDIPLDAHLAPISDSFTPFLGGVYAAARMGRPFYRNIDIPPLHEGKGVKIINETIDGSVFRRWREDSAYRPENLISWGKRKQVNPADITTSVRADSPLVPVPG